MSLVAARLSLTHRCTIERDTNAGTPDAWGTPETPSWQPHLTELPCRGWTRAGVETADATTTTVVEDMRLIVSLGTDVTEQDRVNGVTDRGTTIIIAGPVGIRAVIGRKDHLELVLVRIS
jgi:hypothetical protein